MFINIKVCVEDCASFGGYAIQENEVYKCIEQSCKNSGYKHYYSKGNDYLCINTSCQTSGINKPFADKTTGECLAQCSNDYFEIIE